MVNNVSDDEHESPIVLIVEDERGLAELYELWLQDDYEVRTAFDGEHALELVDEAVSVVLLDRRLPGLSGDDVLERIREQELDCRVAMVSAVKADFDVLEMEFDDYVSKPVSQDALRETVERLVTLATYDRDIREYYALVSKKAALETQKSASELETSETYTALEGEINDVRAQLDATQTDLRDEEFERVFRGML